MITHSPFILSDILNDKVLFLDNNKNTFKNIKTFGANIHELLSHSFFMKKGLLGEYAKGTITNIIDFLNHKNDIYENKQDDLFKIINYIGEDFLREKLTHMYDLYYKSSKDTLVARLKEEEKKIQQQIKEIENDSD